MQQMMVSAFVCCNGVLGAEVTRSQSARWWSCAARTVGSNGARSRVRLPCSMEHDDRNAREAAVFC